MVSSIIVAAGSGKRMGKSVNKVFLDLNGYPVLYHSIKAFQDHPDVEEIILVLKETEFKTYDHDFAGYGFSKVKQVVAGGAERMDSVWNGLLALSPGSDIVLIHDGARPFVTLELISQAIRLTREHGAACPAVVPKDTIKVVSRDSFIEQELARESLRALQTPQTFATVEFKRRMEEARATGKNFTDDTAVFTEAGLPVFLYPGSYDNLKITTTQDLELCRILAMNWE